MANKFQLTELQKIILSELAKSSLKKTFYWTGGTALAFFYLEHRQSYDIDLFSDKLIDYPSVKKLVDTISKRTKLDKIEEKKISDRWEFFLKNKTQTRLDFVHYDYQNIASRKNWQGILVDSFEDMLANKTMALIDRNDPKDAFDIYYFLTKLNFSPKKLLDLVNKKFKSKFPLSLFWSRCLLGARQFNGLEPLILSDNNQLLIEKIETFFEKKSAENIKTEI